jgi:methylthioribose-1-phosphate isomerase
LKRIDNLPLEWRSDRLIVLDQTRLPQQEVYEELDDYRSIADAIKELKIRGAPAIGVAGAYAVALGALKIKAETREEFLNKLGGVTGTIAGTRPTARNLFHAIKRMERITEAGGDVKQIKAALVDEAV